MIIHTALYKKIEPKLPVVLPEQSGSLTYTGGVQSPSWSGFYDNIMTISGETSGTNAGTYTVTFKLKDKKQYEWADGTQGSKNVTWTIGKAVPTFDGEWVNGDNIISNKSTNATFNFTTNSDGALWFTSIEDYVGVRIVLSGHTAYFSLVDEEKFKNEVSGELLISVPFWVEETTNYEKARLYPEIKLKNIQTYYLWDKYDFVDEYQKPEDFINTTTQLNFDAAYPTRLCNYYTVDSSTGACLATGNYKDISWSDTSSSYTRYGSVSDYEYAIVNLSNKTNDRIVAKRKNLSGYWYNTKISGNGVLQISPTTSEPTTQNGLEFYYWKVSKTTGKGSEVIETVTSTSRDAYPDDGVSGSYWYVYKGEEER